MVDILFIIIIIIINTIQDVFSVCGPIHYIVYSFDHCSYRSIRVYYVTIIYAVFLVTLAEMTSQGH